jgi:hypothetical protein
MSLKDRFTSVLEKMLTEFNPNFEKSFQTQFGDVEVTTYYCKMSNVIVDVLDDECCLTAKKKNFVFAFYDDDYMEVVDDVLNEITKPIGSNEISCGF